MTSSNVFTLLALLRTITNSGRKTLIDCFIEETSENTVFSLILKQLINDLYILEISKNNENKKNLEHVLHLYKKVYDPIKDEKSDLSIKEFATILSKLSFNFSQFFLWQDRLIKFYKWKSNKKTISYLFLLSLLLYKPILFVTIPLIYLIYFYVFNNKASSNNDAIKSPLNKKKYLDLDLEPNVIYFIEFIFNLTDLQNLLSYLTLCSEKIENFLTNKNQASKSIATVIVYLVLVLFFGGSKFFIIQLWYHFLKKKLCIILTTEQKTMKKRKKSFTFNLLNDIVKKEEFMKVYEIQKLSCENKAYKSWEIVVYSKRNVFESKTLGQANLSLNIKGFINLDNIVPNKGFQFKPNSKWVVESNDWALNEKFHLTQNIFTFTHESSKAGNLKEYVYLKNTNYRIKRLSRKIVANKELHQDRFY